MRVLGLSSSERSALAVLADGMARRSVRTESDRARGIHAVRSVDADVLVCNGFARDVSMWNAVEITDAGREALDP